MPSGIPTPPPKSSGPGTAGRAGRGFSLARRPEAWVALIVLALAARVAFAFLIPARLLWEDPKEYFELGRVLHAQGTYGLQTLRPPGYPTFIAGVFALFGPNLMALRLVEAVLATATVGLIGLLAVRRFGPAVGWVATALAALHPLLAFMPATSYPESLSALLFVLGLLTAFEGLERRGGGWWVATGVLLGLQTLVRPNIIALIPGLGLGFVILLLRSGRSPWMPAAVAALAFVVTLAPWVIRNHHVHHRWYFVSTGGGRQLWAGNNPSATGFTNQGTPVDPRTRDVLDTLPNDIVRDKFFMSESIRFMRTQPGRAFQLYLRKLGNIFALFPDTYSRTYVNPASKWAQGTASVILDLGVLLGLLRLRSAPALWPMLMGTATFVLATALAFSSLRYRLPVEPALIVTAAFGLTPWLARVLPLGGPAAERNAR